jgi:polysaccharide deacetylase 2 family uncharacterized protein YibQ
MGTFSMRPARGAKPGDPYFVFLTVAMLAAFGAGLTHPHRSLPAIAVANATAEPPLPPAVFLRASREEISAWPMDLPVEPAHEPNGDDLPTIAIVIDDLGASPEVSARASGLPKAVTLSFLPLGSHVAPQVKAASELGHEVLLHLPMEAQGGVDAGPHALRVNDSAAAIAAKLDFGLSLIPGAIGLNNHMGSRFTADASSMSRLARALRGRDLIFLDSRTTGRSLAARFVKAAGLPVAPRDFFIDHERATRDEVLGALSKAAIAALNKGSIVVIAHPYASTLSALETWCRRAHDLRLVSLSDHVRQQSFDGGRFALARVPASAY